MTRIVRTCMLALLGLSPAGLAAAQTVPASFGDLQFLVKPGDRVTVVDTNGYETKGRISELDGSALSIKARDGERRFRQEDVVVIRHRTHDSIRNGMAIGAAIGAGLGAIAEFSAGAYNGYHGYTGVMTIGNAIWGSMFGAVADGLHTTSHDVFRRAPDGVSGALTVTPLVGRRAAGAQVALRW